MEIPNQPVVIDNGSGSIKAGFAGEDKPRVIFPNYVGQPKYQRVLPGALLKESFVGKQMEC
jgi:centractin